MFLLGLDNLEKYVNTFGGLSRLHADVANLYHDSVVYAMRHKELCGYVSGCQLYFVRHFGTAIPLINSLN